MITANTAVKVRLHGGAVVNGTVAASYDSFDVVSIGLRGYETNLIVPREDTFGKPFIIGRARRAR